MPDEPTGEVEPGTDTGADSSGAGTAAGAQAGDEARTFTQEEVNRILAEQRRKIEPKSAELTDLRSKLAAFEQAEADRKAAQMTELEKAQAVAAEAAKRAEAAEAREQAAQQAAMRANLVAAKGADLPELFRGRVTGSTEEEVLASLQEQRQAVADLQTQFVRDLSAALSERIAETYGEAGQALAARLAGTPVSIGAPPAPTGQPAVPQPWDPRTPPTDMNAVYDRLAQMGVQVPAPPGRRASG